MNPLHLLAQDRVAQDHLANYRPDGPSWFPYAFVGLVVVLGIVILIRIRNGRR
ncbi:hypothetical protein [Streptomyces bikiniensis]|uniref:hypothetical protein n=1 Tax=Streptomyces bikiniensis TaxID=1896 RepID=UPI000A520218|nr:hypothetical protein [Streptomyces bikiniensis]